MMLPSSGQGDASAIRAKASPGSAGVGASQSDPGPSSGLGQRLIRSMAAQLGGQVTVEPTAGLSGTTVTVRFPVAA
jgi:two-component sensor histidine kinase